MKTSRLLPLGTLLVAGAMGAAAFVGCGGSSNDPPPVTTTDSGGGGVDLGTPDTKPPADTGAPKPDTGPITCAQDLPSDFACTAPTKPMTSKVCTEAMVQSFLTACYGSGTADQCTKWRKDFAECDKCIIGQWHTEAGFNKSPACYAFVKPDGVCAKAAQCNADCRDAVCGECDRTPGSGTTPSASEFSQCASAAIFAGSATRPKGRCYDVAAKEFKTCSADAVFDPCNSLESLFRGACRDGGDWTNAGSAGDAGTPPADTGTPPADTGTPPADTGISVPDLGLLPG